MVSRNVNRQWLVDNNEPPVSGNVIVLGVTLPAVSYQPYEFGASQVITASADFLNERIGLYFVALLQKQMVRFSYSKKPGINIYKELQISLPITESGEIDFAFMQARIQEMEQARIQEMDAYLKVAGFEDCELTEDERLVVNQMLNNDVKFKTFFITDDISRNGQDGVFYVNNSHNILQSSIITGSGNTPYVTAGEGNNSIFAYISFDRSQIEKGNAIMIGGKTMVITYQAEDFFSNDSHNLVLYAKDDRLRNELIQLFMVASLNKSLKPIYSWGDSISKAKIKKDKFQLPVSSSGQIDYKFMETYIRAQEKLAIQRVKNWRATEIETTKNIVYAKPDQVAQQSVSCYIISSSDVISSQRYITHLPVYPLRAACGYFDANGSLPEEEAEGWIDVSAQMNKLDKGMFIVHAEGQSMEPKIHDGDLCVFNSSAAGSRQGTIVLVKARDISDPSASSFTIKKYSSNKVSDEDNGWRHTHITLSPLNPNYRSIEISAEGVEDGEFKIYGEFVKVINAQ